MAYVNDKDEYRLKGNRGNNKFTSAFNEEETVNEVNANNIILNILRDEFPDDPFFINNRLTPPPVSRPKTFQESQTDPELLPGAERNSKNILQAKSEKDEYAFYRLTKDYPTVDEEELDELIDEEWEFFEDPDEEDDVILEPAPNGLFLVNSEVDLTDFHDLYLRYGPQRLEDPPSEEEDPGNTTSEDAVEKVFCVFFIRNGVAQPIPTYKTLEVMLVERGLTYEDITEATPEEIQEFDLQLDGEFNERDDKELADEDEDGEVTPLEEFRFRQVINRDSLWTPQIRFRSGYIPKAPFLRDPGDYIKPESIRAPQGRTAYDPDNGDPLPPDLYQKEDPEDMYFDQVFQPQTWKEQLRAKYEGKMVVLDWPNPEYIEDVVTADTDIQSDDPTQNVRIMINGFWKRIRDIGPYRLYAAVNDYDLGQLDPDPPARITGSLIPGLNPSYGERGIVQLLVNQGGIEVIHGTTFEYENSQAIEVWNSFQHIVEADDDGIQGVDEVEYKEYLNNYNNGGAPFNIPHLEPYEPEGSLAYYNKEQYAALTQQALDQLEIDGIKDTIYEMWPEVASKIEGYKVRLEASPDNFSEYLERNLGGNSDLYKLFINQKKEWKLVKKKRKKTKRKKSHKDFFKMCSKSTTIKWSMPERVENKIVSKYKWMKSVKRDKFAAWMSGGNNEVSIPALNVLADEGSILAAQAIAAGGQMGLAYAATDEASELVAEMLNAGIAGAQQAAEVALGGAAITGTVLVGTNLLMGGSIGLASGGTAIKLGSALGTLTGGPGLSALIANPFFVAGAGLVAGFMIANWIAGETPADEYILPPWRFMDDQWYLKACIFNEVDDQVTELATRAGILDYVFPAVKQDVLFLYSNMWMIDALIVNGTEARQFRAALELLRSTKDALEVLESGGVLTEGIQCQDDIDNLFKKELRKQYKAIQFVRKKVYKKAGLWNRKNFGIIWPAGAQKILNKHVPGCKFDNFLPEGVS